MGFETLTEFVFPVWVTYLPFPVGFGMLILFAVEMLWQELRRARQACERGRAMIYVALALGIVTLLISVPIFLVFGMSGSLVVINALNLPWSMVTQVTFDSITKYILLAIPLFIFSGMIMVEGGMARRLVAVFTDAVGHWRGGLGIAMVLAMGFFGALCGSILAAIVAIGTIMIPVMVEKGYPRPFVAALAACSGFFGHSDPSEQRGDHLLRDHRRERGQSLRRGDRPGVRVRRVC